jgi:serine/threonine protein kinase
VPAGPGDLVANYRIESELGRGGMSVVFRARDLRSGAEVALKAPLPGTEVDPDAFRRVLREVRVVSRLVHPNIVMLRGAFEHEGLPWLAFELVDGRSLADRIEREGPLPAAEIARIGADLAGALEFAHARGSVHGDVTPRNILIASNGVAKIADFGLASFASAPGRNSAGPTLPKTVRRTIAGVPAYLAPELILGHPPDGRSDIFALGAVLYEMSTGRRAFPGMDNDEVLESILQGAAVSLAPGGGLTGEDAPRPDPLPAALITAIERALAHDPDGRYQRAADLQAELRRLL